MHPSAIILQRAKICEGAVVKQYVTIGKDCIIGAGTVVLEDVPDGMTIVGVPAREIKR